MTYNGPFDVDRLDLPTDLEIALVVQSGGVVHGRFLLTAATRIVRPTLEQLRVAIALANQVGAASPPPISAGTFLAPNRIIDHMLGTHRLNVRSATSRYRRRDRLEPPRFSSRRLGVDASHPQGRPRRSPRRRD